MRNFTLKEKAGPLFLLAVLEVACVGSAALSQEPLRNYSPASSFKLKVSRFENTYEMIPTDGWKLPKKVDSRLISRISGVRMSLPSWQGVHYLAPGARGN